MNNKNITNHDLKIFGIIWGVIFSVISYHSENMTVAFAILAFAFFLISFVYPEFYVKIKFYQNWVKFGNVLGKVNGFLISFILFYIFFAPVGIILRILKKDLLNKKLDSSASSYFIDRKDQPGDMRNQF